MTDDLPEQLGHPADDDARPVREDLRDHLGKRPLDEPDIHDPADHGLRRDHPGGRGGHERPPAADPTDD